jgi:hypothetical protein
MRGAKAWASALADAAERAMADPGQGAAGVVSALHSQPLLLGPRETLASSRSHSPTGTGRR